jgi:mannosyltransferase OCH1-like enzyme
MMIPKTLHQMWIGGDPPPFIVDCLRTASVLDDWERTIWTDDNVEQMFPLANQGLWDKAGDISPRPLQFRADVFRYEILWRYGGVWADADFEFIKPLDPLLDEPFATFELEGHWVNNAMIGVPRHHPTMAAAMDLLEANIENVSRRRAKPPNTILSGPKFFTPIARRALTIHPQAWFYPYGYAEVDAYPAEIGQEYPEQPDLYAVHHWNNKRTEKNLW